jgi:hypothetical protein
VVADLFDEVRVAAAGEDFEVVVHGGPPEKAKAFTAENAEDAEKDVKHGGRDTRYVLFPLRSLRPRR